jgi:hypothetical protein
MLKILGLIALILAIGVVGLIAYAATQPDEFRLARSKSIMAPPEKIFPLISNLHRFNEWNPFAKQDPAINIIYSGPASGKGAAHEWESAGRTGKGRLEITDVSPLSQIDMKLDILKPIEGHNKIVFTLQPDGSATNVTWSMTGKTPFLGKVLHLFLSMDRMVGDEFEKGLADLKALAEGGGAVVERDPKASNADWERLPGNAERRRPGAFEES